MDTKHVTISIDNINLLGNLCIPPQSQSIIIFAHGSGSSRLSPRNRFVANAFNKENFATLLFDLLTYEEEIIDDQTAELRFNIQLLANRLVSVTRWLHEQPEAKLLSMGYFGASTGAGAALIAGAELPHMIKAIVSRGGRPDLAGAALKNVEAPTLLIVGELDEPVIELNHEAMKQMHSETKLEIVSGATHLFEESGRLEIVTYLAYEWFKKHLYPTL